MYTSLNLSSFIEFFLFLRPGLKFLFDVITSFRAVNWDTMAGCPHCEDHSQSEFSELTACWQ